MQQTPVIFLALPLALTAAQAQGPGGRLEAAAAAVAATSPRAKAVVPPSEQEPVKEDVRAPEGGIAARMAMLAQQQQSGTNVSV